MTEMTRTNSVTTQATPVDVQETHQPERFVAPLVDIWEKEDALVVVADMPGLTQEAITIGVEKDVLTLRGSRAATQTQGPELIWREFEPTGYFRQFRLGNRIDQARISAEYRHGVLQVVLPFAEETKPRQIAVKVG